MTITLTLAALSGLATLVVYCAIHHGGRGEDRCPCGAPLPVDPCMPFDVAVCDACCPVCAPTPEGTR